MDKKKRGVCCRLRLCWPVVLKYLAAFLIPAVFAMIMRHELDNDSWGLLAEGRYIVEHGLYSTDVLSIHSVPIVVSNYAFAVCFWGVHALFGAAGIYVCMIVLNFLVCFLVYKICILLSKRNVNLSLAIMMATDILLILVGFVVTRAQMFTFVMMLGLIYLLELYIAEDKTKYLWWIPLLSLIQINFHASYWWLLIVIVVVYIIDSFRNRTLHLHGYRTKPLLIVLFLMMLVGLINPYGIQMITSIFGFYFDGALNNIVNELQRYSPFIDAEMMFVYLSIMLVAFWYLVGDKKGIRIRYYLLFFGFLALSLNTVKAISQLILVMWFPLALMYKKVFVERLIDSPVVRRAICCDMGIMAVVAFMALFGTVVANIAQEPDLALVEAVNAIDLDVSGDDKTTLRVYTGYNDGGYLEYRGYKAYLDPRGNPSITKEYGDFKNGKITTRELLDKYHFDYLVVRSQNDPFYGFKNDDCELLYKVGEDEEVYRCFKGSI